MAGAHLGNDIRFETFFVSLPKQCCGIPDHTDGKGFLLFRCLFGHLNGFVQVFGLDVGKTDFDAFVDDVFLHIHVDTHATMHTHGPRLVGTHTAVTGSQQNTPGHIAPKVAIGDGAQRLKSPLDHALGTDIFPGSGRVLGEDGKIFVLQIVKGGPVRLHDVGGSHDHGGRKFMGLEDGHRHTRLDHQGFIIF